jgi:hypothetical protein
MFYIPLEWAVWMSDPALSLCSPATRGIWIDLICNMQATGRTGIATGFRPALARATRCSADDLAGAFNELTMYNVADISESDNGVVTVVNRKMNREHKERVAATLRQQKARAKEGDSPSVTPPVTGASRPIVQSSEFKVQEGSDKVSKPLTEGGAGGNDHAEGRESRVECGTGKPLRGRQADIAALCEAVLNGQWINDAGKWIERIRENPEKVWRVMAEVKNAASEGRIKTTAGQMAEFNWKKFK